MEKFWSIKKVIYAIFKTSFPIFIISWWNSNGFPKHFSPLHLTYTGLSQKSSPARNIEGFLFWWFYFSKGAICFKLHAKLLLSFKELGVYSIFMKKLFMESFFLFISFFSQQYKIFKFLNKIFFAVLYFSGNIF